MPPRKRESKKPVKYEDDADAEAEVEEETVVDVSGSEEEEKPKKRKKSSTPKKPKYDAVKEPETTEDGWTLQPPSIIYRGFKGSEPSDQIAAFDLDGTLALQKSAARFPRDADDWVLYNKKVPEKLKELEDQGYKLVVFSNQGSIKSALKGKAAAKITGRVSNILNALKIQPPTVLATNKDSNRKPETGMWDFFVAHGNGGVEPDKSKCFFVGDAAGGADDFADSDKIFAANLGIAFKTPSEFFGKPDGKVQFTPEGSKGFNDDMAQAFRELAEAQQAEGGTNAFAGRAYLKAADIIAGYPSKITSGKQLASIKGIGKGSITKIDEFIANGSLSGVKKDPEVAAAMSKEAEMGMKFI